MQKNPLIQFGGIPVRTDIVVSLFSDLAAPEKKLLALEKDGQLIRLKRGLYVVNQDLSGVPINICLCANQIYGPSYISLQWALKEYGLIPEGVRQLTSVTTKRSKTFTNSLGYFSYYQVASNYYSIGLQIVETDSGVSYLMASPEKALCDMLLYDSYIPANSKKALMTYLEDDLRIDIDQLKTFDTSIIEECARCGRKVEIFNNIIDIIKGL